MKSEMNLDKKLAIGCFVGIPLFLLFLISLVFWIDGYKRGYSEYQACFERVDAYLSSSMEEQTYRDLRDLLRSLVSKDKYADERKITRDVLTPDLLIPFVGTFQLIGDKMAVRKYGSPDKMKEKIYQFAKAALDSENYLISSHYFMVLVEYDYKDSKDLLVKARSKNRHGLKRGDFLNLGNRKWDVDGSRAPMSWMVKGENNGILFLAAAKVIEYRAYDKNFCNWLNDTLFKNIFADGSGAAVAPLDLSLLVRLSLSHESSWTEGSNFENKLYCQELGNKIFIINPRIFSFGDVLAPPYLEKRRKMIKDSTGVYCCYTNGVNTRYSDVGPEHFFDSVIAVRPAIFVDTLLLKQF